MTRRGSSAVKVTAAVILAAIVGGAVLLTAQEEKARSAANAATKSLMQAIADAETSNVGTPNIEDVHGLIARKPDVERRTYEHRYVEEYLWKGPFGDYRLYAYYRTGADKFLEAVSLNEKLVEWESDH